MAYEYSNDDDAYEMMDDGEIVKSPHHTTTTTVHRTGSIHISSLGSTRNENEKNRKTLEQTNNTTTSNSNTNPHSNPTHDYPAQSQALTNTYQTSSSSNSSSNDITTQLGAKIRRQAGELQRLQEALQQSQAYSRLCEQRVCDLHPNHPVPITKDSLGIPSPLVSHSTGNNGSSNAGGIAKLRREKASLEQANTQLEKQLNVARNKVTESSRNLKEVRQQLSAKDRELSFHRKKVTNLESNIQQLEVDLRINSTEANNTSNTVLPSSSEKIISKNESLEKELTALRQTLQSEARTSEEQRVYIAVLEKAVQAKAFDMGLEKGQANLLTKLAKLQGELNAKVREQEQSESALKAFEVEMEDIRKRDEEQQIQSNVQVNKIHQLSEQLKQISRGEDDLLNAVKNLESEKSALLDYVEDNASRVAGLSHQVQLLESEKITNNNAYQTMVREHKQALSEINANKELLQIKLKECQASYESITSDADSLRERLALSDKRNGELEEELQQHINDIKELREVQNELLETIREKVNAASASTRELSLLKREDGSNKSEITTLQSKLDMLQVRMDAQKDLLRQDAKAATDALENKLSSVTKECENYKNELNNKKNELIEMNKALNLERNHVMELEDLRDELVGERDSQSLHLTELSEAQEKTEQTLNEALNQLESTEEELVELRSKKNKGKSDFIL